MRAHILAIAAVSGVVILSLAAGHAVTECLLAATAPPAQPRTAAAATVPHK